MKSQEAPPLSGPVRVRAPRSRSRPSPDVLTQDGASQSLDQRSPRETRTARRCATSRCAPRSQVGGVHADFGSLSARNLVTGSDGRATVVYTAPRRRPAWRSTTEPSSTSSSRRSAPTSTTPRHAPRRSASFRPGASRPPDGLKPNFTFTPMRAGGQPAGPVRRQREHRRRPANPIASYSWNFGDGGRGSGVTAGHSYADRRFLRRHADDLRRASGARAQKSAQRSRSAPG